MKSGNWRRHCKVKLLRVLQERRVRARGRYASDSGGYPSDRRHNQDLAEAVKNGTFRKDLYYRLNVVSLVMPPLRERREDIPILADYFVAKYARSST